MTAKINGHHMPIGYGDPSHVAETLRIGERYCSAALGPRPPRFTREAIERLGGTFPKESPPIPHKPVKAPGKRAAVRRVTDYDVARILAGYDAGKTVAAIAESIGRATCVVRRILREHGKDTHRFCGNPSRLRPRVLELHAQGKGLAEIAAAAGCGERHVRNIIAGFVARGMRKEAA